MIKKNLEEYCRSNDMIINKGKTKVMLFNTSRKYDGTPKLSLILQENMMERRS